MSEALEPYQGPATPALRAGALDYPTMLQLGAAFAASGLFPGVKDQGVAVVKILAGVEMGLEPVAAMNGIDIIAMPNRPPRMRPNADVQTLLARRAGYDFTPIEHTAEKCVLEWRHNGKVLGTSEFSVAQAQKARLVRDGGAWQAWPENMTLARAITQGVKLYCRHILAGSIGGMQIVTTDELEQEYPDPRDDLMRALFAAYRERFPYPVVEGETRDEHRAQRLAWSAEVLDRPYESVTTWNGPEAPETLTRADVQILLDALQSSAGSEPLPETLSADEAPVNRVPAEHHTQPAPAREPAAPVSPGTPASGAESTASPSSAGNRGRTPAPPVTGTGQPEAPPPAEHYPQGSAGDQDTPLSGQEVGPMTPAEHHTAEVSGEVAPAVGTTSAGSSRSDTGQPSGPAPASTAKEVADGLYEKAFGRRVAPAAPTRKRQSVDLTDEARKASVVRNTRPAVYRPPSNWLHTLPTPERHLVLARCGHLAREAGDWLGKFAQQEGLTPLGEWGEDEQWPEDKLTLLRETLKAEGSAK